MPDTGEENTLNPDAPLKYLEDDQLGYNEYAAYLTQVLSSQLPLDGYVVGINGRWGVGKSTMLNFVEQHLKDADNPPIVVRFSPWLFSGQADLTNKFLEEFGESLEDEDEERFEGLRSRMESLASSLSGIPISVLLVCRSNRLQEFLFNFLVTRTNGQLVRSKRRSLTSLDRKSVV